MLGAQRKAGKTTLVDNLVRSLADGGRFLGVAEVVPVNGRVAIIDFEMSAAMLDRWLADQGIEDQDRVVVIPLRGRAATFDLRDEAVLEEWATILRDYRVEYLILDCLRPWMDALGLDENREAGILLTALDTLLAHAGIPDALVVQHMGHEHERTRGDSRIRDWPEVEWRLVRESDDDASPRYISAYGRDVDHGETKLHFDPATRRLTLAEGSRKDAAGIEALDAVVDVLSDAPLTGRAVERALAESNFDRGAIRAALKIATRDGLLTTQPRKARGGGTEYVISDQVRQVRGTARARSGSAPSASIGRALLTSPAEAKCAEGEADQLRLEVLEIADRAGWPAVEYAPGHTTVPGAEAWVKFTQRSAVDRLCAVREALLP